MQFIISIFLLCNRFLRTNKCIEDLHLIMISSTSTIRKVELCNSKYNPSLLLFFWLFNFNSF